MIFLVRLNQLFYGLANGNIDVEGARGIIEQEVERRIQSKKSSSKFVLTPEQEKGQIFMQIKMALQENSESFPINNPVLTVSKTQELCGGTSEQILKIVIKNLIACKEFDEAKELFDNFCKKRGNRAVVPKDLVPIKKEIRNAEIAYMVLKVINMRGTEQEQARCWGLVEKGVRNGNVRLSSIDLGTSIDGLRKITLEDIWPDEGEIARINWAAGK